jgi:hypothetical protein
LCQQDYVDQGYCNSTDIGEFILAANATEESSALILTEAVNLEDPAPIHYSITKTGYYCILTEGFNTGKYKAVVEFRNAYGELAATQIPKLPFYGGITILYALMAVYWGFLYYQHRQDICESRHLLATTELETNPFDAVPVQNYITAILGFLVVEMILTWGYYGMLSCHHTNYMVGALWRRLS